MTQKLIILRGLPGSGKSTFAKNVIAASGPEWVRINKDSIRSMLGRKHSHGAEKNVEATRDAAIRAMLSLGKSVIVDDTNIAQRHLKRLREIGREFGIDAEIKSLMDTPVKKCIEQDLERGRAGGCVGKDVILKMYYQYWAGELKPLNNGPERAILCDIDGTLALFGDENPYNRDFSKDTVNQPVAMTLEAMRARPLPCNVILMSGRDGSFREVTEKWLFDNGISYDYLFMREAGDNRNDAVVKKEMYVDNVLGKFTVMFVLDDRPQVVRMWRAELGLTVFQVAPDMEF